jgi:very-short-patch-repair endonuclease
MAKLTGDPVLMLTRFGGVASAGQLRAVCDSWAIRKAVRAGVILRPGPRRYALPTAADGLVAAARVGGILAGPSAAAYWGWALKEQPSEPWVLFRRGWKRPEVDRDGLVIRWSRVPDEDVHDGRVTSPLRTVVDCLRWLPEPDALCVADSAIRSRRVSRPELIAALEQGPAYQRGRALRLATMADGRAANPFESVLRWVASTVPGLDLEPQGDVDGIGHGDLVDKHLRLVIEAESHEFHTEKAAFRYDCRRYTAMVRAAWRVVRFVYEDVMGKPDYVRDVLRDLVALGPQTTYSNHAPGVDRRVMGGI